MARNAELVTVYSPHTGEDVARQFGVVAADSEQDLLESDCDAVYVASPVDCHVRQVIQAAAAGKHILCEKPLALNVLEANKMVAACQRAGVLLGVAFMMRNHPLHCQIRDLVRSGRIGQPTYARAQLACWYPPMDGAWRQDARQSSGGALPDLAPHCLDLLEMILEQKIICVSAVVKTTFHNYSVDDTAVLAIEFDGGTVATVDCLFNVPDQAASNRLEVYGSRGSILADGTLGQTATGAMKWFEEGGGWHSASYHAENMYLTQIEEFGSAVVANRPLDASGEQGLWIQRILAACEESAASGRRVATHSS